MNNLFVKKSDTVLVIAGKDKGKIAKVSGVSNKSKRVLVEGVNIVSKNKKAKTAQEKSTIVKVEAPIDVSNVMIVCPQCKKATRVAHKIVNGHKVRICKHCGASLDKEFVKQVKKSKKAEEKQALKDEPKKVAPKEEKKPKVVTKKEERKVDEVGTKAKAVKKPAFRKV
jgi:large subunit ribosomal protein L24